MKKLFAILFLLTNSFAVLAQERSYGHGEYFKFRVHYGFVTAGYATLNVNNATFNGKEVFHVKGFGETVGLSKWFFKVEDDYQSYIDKEKDIPYYFIRKINEGGYTKDIEINFNHDLKKATVKDNKHNETAVFSFPKGTQDMISAFYYLRNHLNSEKIQVGEVIEINMFFDKENYKFRLKFLGKEILDTNFGRVSTLVFRPFVQSGRVFKEKESLTVWVSNDKNKIPLLIKADLAVGSLKATLTEFKGLQHSFKIIAD
ncbi:MAG: ATP-dependent exonuclease [Aequorivita sp.]|nr:ATP-dependent exonuclease [Aequorivita sp.]|tara:strand:+ start:813 stop:1586 length:774 start_codon:yes stop_codon:yes gene_type:complete